MFYQAGSETEQNKDDKRDGQTVAAENVTKEEDMCSRIFYSVAEIRVRDDSGGEEEAKHWIYGRTRVKIIIYSWGEVETGGGAEMTLGGVLYNDLWGGHLGKGAFYHRHPLLSSSQVIFGFSVMASGGGQSDQ